MTEKEKKFEQMVDKAFEEYEKETGQHKLVLSDVEFQQFQDVDIKEIEEMLDRGYVNKIEL